MLKLMRQNNAMASETALPLTCMVIPNLMVRVDRGHLSHFLLEDFCIFLRLIFREAKISSELLATIEQ